MRALTVIAAAIAFVKAQSGDACLDQCLTQVASAVGCSPDDYAYMNNAQCICSSNSRWQTFKDDVIACSQSCDLSTTAQFSRSCNGDTLTLPAPPIPSSPSSPALSSPSSPEPSSPIPVPPISAPNTPVPFPTSLTTPSFPTPSDSGSLPPSPTPSGSSPTSRPSSPLVSSGPSGSPPQTSQGRSSHVGAIVGGVVGGVGGALILVGLAACLLLRKSKKKDSQDEEKPGYGEGKTASGDDPSSSGDAANQDNSGSQGPGYTATQEQTGSVSPSNPPIGAGVPEKAGTSY